MITIDDLNTPEKRNKLYRITTRLEYPRQEFIVGDKQVSGIIGELVPVVGIIYSISGIGNAIDEVVIVSRLTGDFYHVAPSELEEVE